MEYRKISGDGIGKIMVGIIREMQMLVKRLVIDKDNGSETARFGDLPEYDLEMVG